MPVGSLATCTTCSTSTTLATFRRPRVSSAASVSSWQVATDVRRTYSFPGSRRLRTRWRGHGTTGFADRSSVCQSLKAASAMSGDYSWNSIDCALWASERRARTHVSPPPTAQPCASDRGKNGASVRLFLLCLVPQPREIGVERFELPRVRHRADMGVGVEIHHSL